MFKKHKANLLTNYLQTTGENLLDDINFIKKRKQKRFWHNVRLVIYTLIAIILFLSLNIAIFYPSAKFTYQSALTGKDNLLQASSALQQGQFRLATDLSQEAETNWQTALVRLKAFKYTPAGWLPYIRPKLNDAQRLLEAGSGLSQAMTAIVKPGNTYLSLLFNSNTKFSQLTTEDKTEILRDLYASRDGLAEASYKLETVLISLERIQDYETLEKFNIDIFSLQDNVRQTKDLIDKAVPISKALPLLAGYPSTANYLFILQNKDELRPTGGFIGTLGLGQIKNGEIIRLDTKDVYHLDMPAVGKLKIEPPAPIAQYLNVDYWYLRDANWSPDWPTSAKQIMTFYQQENNLLAQPDELEDFDFVIAINPDLITDLMVLTGPITVNGQVYTAENLVDLLQDSTGKDFAKLGYIHWDRKTIVGLLAKEMQIKLMDSLSENWQEMFNILINNLDQKNILVYARDYDINQLAVDHGWAGQVSDTNGDYFMVVDSNMAALKTDAVMNRHINYELTETDNGLIARLTINYANHGQFSWKTTRYRSYTRVYVPLGSQLIKAAGFMSDQVETGEDLNKTYFASFISIEPGSMTNLYLEYRLPDQVAEMVKLGKYSLLAQKQPGSQIKDLRVDLQFQNPIQLYNPAIFYSYLLGDRRVRWDTDFRNDKRFEINL